MCWSVTGALHREALDFAAAYVDQLPPEGLLNATPCVEWTLGELLAHMIGQHRGFARAVSDGYAPVSAYLPAPFTASAWHESVSRLLAAFADADLGGTCVAIEVSAAPLSIGRIVNAQLLDTVIHTWDIAQARHLPFEPRGELSDTVAVLATSIPDHARRPGAPFGPRLASTGTPWQRTLAALGRRHFITVTPPEEST